MIYQTRIPLKYLYRAVFIICFCIIGVIICFSIIAVLIIQSELPKQLYTMNKMNILQTRIESKQNMAYSMKIKKCDAEEERNRFMLAGGAMSTGCPDNSVWMKQFAKVDPSPQKMIVFVGCNKGVDAVDLFSLYDNSLIPFNSDLWRNVLKKLLKSDLLMNALKPMLKTDFGREISEFIGIDIIKDDMIRKLKSDDSKDILLKQMANAFGSCGQILFSPQLDDRNRNLDEITGLPIVYCIEPMNANIKLLKESVKLSSINNTYFKVQQFAVGDTNKLTTIDFPDAEAGTEYIGISKQKTKHTVEVNYISLDLLFKNISKIDILSIDAEGHDPSVLFGGVVTLMKTRYLEFEVHSDLPQTVWGMTTLKSVIQYLNRLEFDCFWMNNKGQLFQITNCWHPEYDTPLWGNVACVKRNDLWHDIMQNIHKHSVAMA